MFLIRAQHVCQHGICDIGQGDRNTISPLIFGSRREWFDREESKNERIKTWKFFFSDSFLHNFLPLLRAKICTGIPYTTGFVSQWANLVYRRQSLVGANLPDKLWKTGGDDDVYLNDWALVSTETNRATFVQIVPKSKVTPIPNLANSKTRERLLRHVHAVA